MSQNIAVENVTMDEPDLILATAAFFVREFSLDWLQELLGLKATQILGAFEEGIEQGFLRQIRPGIYAFIDHAKQREYASFFSDSQRKGMHHRVTDIIIQEGLNNVDKALAAAHHLLHSDNHKDYCQELILVGDTLRRYDRRQEAMQCYEKAIHYLSKSKGKTSDQLFIDAMIKYSRFFTGEDDPDWIIALLKEAISRSTSQDTQHYRAILKMHLAKNEWYNGQHTLAVRHFNEGWSMAQDSGNPAILRWAVTFRIFFLWWQGRYQDIIHAAEELVPEVDRYPLARFNLTASVLLGSSYVNCGQVTHGLGLLNGLYKHCREIGDLVSMDLACICLGRAFIEIGQVDDAIAYMEELLDKRQKHLSPVSRFPVHGILSDAYQQKKDFARADAHCRESIKLTGQLALPVLLKELTHVINLAMEPSGLIRFPGLSMDTIIERVFKGKDFHAKGLAYRYKAFLQQKEGQSPKHILESLKHSIRWLHKSGHVIDLSRTHIELARTYALLL